MILPAPSFPDKSVALPYQSIFDSNVAQNFVLGKRLELPDGRVFRYAKAGGVALVQAYMNQAAVKESKMVEIVQTGYARAVGDIDISVLVTTGSASKENAFSGGWLVANKVSPAVLGDIYSIVASKLRSTDTILDLKLATAWRNAMLATGEVSLNYSKFFETVVTPTASDTSPAVGVPLCPVPINYFYWAQTKGPCPVIVDTGDTVVIGQAVGNPRTSAVPGACGPVTTVTTEQFRRVWGYAMSIAAADEPALIDLCLE